MTSPDTIVQPSPLLPPFKLSFTNWDWLPDLYRNEDTVFMLLDQNGKRWHLAGPRAGQEGAQFGENIKGLWHAPFQIKWSEGAYQIGSTFERIDIPKREGSFGIILGKQSSVNPGTSYIAKSQYRLIEERWWSGWRDPSVPCWLGCYTRSHGWRWIAVQKSEEPKTTIVRDPVAHDNNLLQWDMSVAAANPFWCKKTFTSQWVNNDQLVAQGNGTGSGLLAWVNRADFGAWPKFLVNATNGVLTVQDGILNRTVKMAQTAVSDGMVLYDTDPMARIATGANEPVDNVFFEIIRSSSVLDFFLGAIADLGEPIWRRLSGRTFVGSLPSKSSGSVTVSHTDPNAVVTMFTPQHYDMPYA